jgi:RNA polymerase sigma factor for flagellar operon FliA
MVDTEEAGLWRIWTGRRDASARNALVSRHQAWARLVARDVYAKTRWKQADWADYVQNAMIGLLEAVDRFDPEQGVEFRTYARHRVRGAVFNGLRDASLIPSSPASELLLERSASLRDRNDAPDSGALQNFTDWVVGLGVGFLLESSMEDGEAAANGPYASALRAESSRRVHAALRNLPSNERKVIVSHYMKHVPFTDIASDMRLTKGRISQLHHQAIKRMRDFLRHSKIEEEICL